MERKKNFFASLTREKLHLVCTTYYMYFVLGVALLLIGSILPTVQQEYGLSYGVSGMLLSMISVGCLVAGAGAGALPLLIGMKRSVMLLCDAMFVGLLLLALIGQPAVLLGAAFLIGISKGAMSNYNNQIVTTLSNADAMPLNLLHAAFAMGAGLAPFVALICGASWRTAIYITLALGIGMLLMQVRMRGLPQAQTGARQEGSTFGFFREPMFLLCLALMCCYQAAEVSFMGWMVTFFQAGGTLTDSFSQVLTSLLWLSLVVGRMICAKLSQRFSTRAMILAMTCGIVAFFSLMLLGKSAVMMTVSTMGLGLCMSGMYGTTVANAGSVFKRYPQCMGMFVAIPGIAAVIAPAVVGAIADSAGIHTGMATLYLPVLFMLGLAAVNVCFSNKLSGAIAQQEVPVENN